MTGNGNPPTPRDILWSPWRMDYILGGRPEGCVFCEAVKAGPGADERLYVVHRGTAAFVVLNIWPYNNGHAMVVPHRHVPDLLDLADDEALEMFHLSRRLVTAYRETMNAEGVNVGLNLGRVSGGSIDHLHLHLVPRWTGDSNFMPVIGNTKVLVERLVATWKRLRSFAW
jgi:ATP adenylyltransferase